MSDIIELLQTAGLTGRGGAAFSSAIKVKAARENKARLIVNVCDGEIGAAKDAWVVENHLSELLDGVNLITGGRRRANTLFAAHRDSRTARLLAEAGLAVLETPERYVSSEETSLISLAHGGLARPMTKKAPFVFGGRDSYGKRIRPTVVLNAETVWRIGQINLYGAEWFRSFGTVDEPGPRLVAVGGNVSRRGVYESEAGTRLTSILAMAGGLEADIEYVNVGGMGGILLTADEARSATWDTPGMKRFGGSMGPGIVTVWNPRDCAVETAARIIAFGAGESAGQCGPCMFGLPALSKDWVAFSENPNRETQWQLVRRLGQFSGRGACHHPEGVARFAQSALRALGPELARHAENSCTNSGGRNYAKLS
jgi:NADH:ubiquinone oxidoreductase subunit F (NADH-binding)